jgi:rhodanese-related sulfurtransferase
MRIDLSRTHRALAAVALVLGLAAAVADRPAGAAIDVEALAREVAEERDHVDALELARWLRDRRDGIRVVDLRSDEEFEEMRIPGAERMSLDSLVRHPWRADETVVLYSEGGTHAAQGWFLLRARGVSHVVFLKGGLYDWITQVVEAKIARPTTADGRARADSIAELSRWFGGMPVVVDDAEATVFPDAVPGSAVPMPSGGAREGGDTREAVRRVRRRGC